MSEPAELEGGCLCRAVRFAARPPFLRMVHCHCSRCRKSSGTGHATNIVLPPAQFRWLQGEDALIRYDLPTAKSFAKWFCSHCGCPLPRPSRASGMMIIPAGSLDQEPPLPAGDHIFWDSRASWSCESQGMPTHAEYPPGW